jgi:hypothetical protein
LEFDRPKQVCHHFVALGHLRLPVLEMHTDYIEYFVSKRKGVSDTAFVSNHAQFPLSNLALVNRGNLVLIISLYENHEEHFPHGIEAAFNIHEIPLVQVGFNRCHFL